MKTKHFLLGLLFSLFFILAGFSQQQIRHRNGAETEFLYMGNKTTVERDALTVTAGFSCILYNTTTSQLEYWDGDSWEPVDGAGIAGVESLEEGSTVILNSTGFNFVGPTVTATDGGSGQTNVTISNDLSIYDNSTSNFSTGAHTIDTDDQTATEVTTITTNFDGSLSAADTNVQLALETLDDATLPTGLEALDEGNGNTYRIIGYDPDNYGPGGLGSVDLGRNSGASSTFGTKGFYGLNFGEDNTQAASIYYQFTGGASNTVSNHYSWAHGTLNIASNYMSTTFGYQNDNHSPYSFSSGVYIVNDDFYTGAFGLGTVVRSPGGFVVGVGNAEYTNTTLNQADSRMFVVGNGTMNAGTPNTVGTRSDALRVYWDGTALLPSATVAEIDTRGSPAIPTVEWINAQGFSTGGGDTSEWATYSGTRVGGDLNVVLGDYDNSNNGNKITINDALDEVRITHNLYIDDNASLNFNSGVFEASIAPATWTSNRNISFPDASGTIALTSDITGTNSGTNTGDQTITNSSDATSHTATLSSSGGSLQLVEGANITLTTTGTGSDGIVTIASTGGGGESTTVSDTAEIDLTLTGVDVSGVLVAGSIDETKLDASVNASLDLADSALQTEVDGSITNELQTIDVSALVGTDLQLSLSNDGEATKVIDLSSLQDGTGTDDQTAAEVSTATGNFDNNLSAADDTVQKALETLDELTAGGGPPVSDTGTTITFTENTYYNEITYLTSGDLTLDLTGAVKGTTVQVYCDQYTPTINGVDYVDTSGSFDDSGLNILSFHYNGTDVLLNKGNAYYSSAPILSLIPKDAEITVNWSSVSTATNYVIERADDSGFTTNLTQIYSGSLLTFDDTGLTNGEDYFYRGKAQGGGFLDSDWSATVSETPIPNPFYDNLVVSMKFNGDVTDNTGTHTPSVAAGTLAYTTAMVGDGGDFAGDAVSIPNHAELQMGSGAFTIAMSIQIDNTLASTYYIMGKFTANGSTSNEYYILATGGVIYFTCFQTGHASAYIRHSLTESLLNDGTLHRLVWTHDGSTSYTGMSLYIDGAVQSNTGNNNGTYTTMADSGRNLYLGHHTNSTSTGLNGTIDQFQLYKGKEWTSGEVSSDWALVSVGTDPVE